MTLHRTIPCVLLSLSLGFARGSETEATPPNISATSESDSNPVTGYKRLSLDQLMDLDVTSASREPEQYRNAPAALVVITQDDIRRSGASSFPEALRLADNLQVAQSASSTWQISARGFNTSVANKLLVLMDGRSIYSPLFSGVIWNMQDYLLEDIDRIEVISGPGGTLWGANAVNGVINIVSKDAKDTQGFYTEAGGGTWLQDFVGLRYGGQISTNVYFRVYGKYFDRGPEVFRDGKDAHDAWDRGQAGFRIDAATTDQDHITFQGDGFGGYNDVVPGGEGSPQERGYSAGGNALARWTHTFAEEQDMTVQMYYDRTHLDAPFQGAGAVPPGTLHHDLDTYDLDFQDRFLLGERQHVVWGFGYRFTHDIVESAPLVAFLPETLDQNLFSCFLQDEIKLLDPLFLTLGSKVEHNDYTGVEYEPNARLEWRVTDKQMIWGAVSRAVRTPSRFDRDLFEPSPTYGSIIAGNSTFRSETVIAYELGYRAQLHKKLSGSLSTYYNDYAHLRSLNLSDTGGLPLRFENHLRGDTYGFELSLNYQMLQWWRWHAGYNFLKETIVVGPGGDFSNGRGETADPGNQVFLRSSMDLPWNLEFDAIGRWVDTVHNNNGSTVGTVPSYAELDLRLAWHPAKNWELAVVGQNLLHDHHPEAGFPGPSQEEINRSVYGKVTWRF